MENNDMVDDGACLPGSNLFTLALKISFAVVVNKQSVCNIDISNTALNSAGAFYHFTYLACNEATDVYEISVARSTATKTLRDSILKCTTLFTKQK